MTTDAHHGDWNFPTHIRFGPGRVREIADACDDAGISRPLLMTDPGLVALAMIGQALSDLDDRGISAPVFSAVQANPVEANVIDGAAAFVEGGHDGVIAIGGGTALDVGKCVAFIARQTRSLFDFEDRNDWWKRADVGSISPVVAIPTTAGTGSEVARSAVITDLSDHTKKVIFHPNMLPVEVIADPELTVGLPPRVTADTGFDALSHNLEAICSPRFHPMAEGIGFEGMRLIHDSLVRAFDDGVDIASRSDMLAASMMGSVAFRRGLGAIHAMSHPCSSLRGTHHGLTIAVLIPYVLERNRLAIDAKMVALARYLDLDEKSFDGVMEWIVGLRERLGVPNTLSEIGIDEELIPKLAEMAAADPSSATNPISLSVDDYAEVYADAM